MIINAVDRVFSGNNYEAWKCTCHMHYLCHIGDHIYVAM